MLTCRHAWSPIRLYHLSGSGFRHHGLCSELSHSLLVFDDEGNWVETLPCPYQLNEGQLAEMRAVIAEARQQTLSSGETHVLARIAERLADTNGTALGSSQHGCNHEPSDPAWRKLANRPDPWEDAHSTGT